MHRSPLYLTLALLIGGCSVGPDYQKPEMKLPGRFSTTQSAEPAIRWWTTFNDPMLNALIEQSLEANLDLRIAESRVREARAQRGIVGADAFPSVNSKASYTRTHVSQNAGVAGFGAASSASGGSTSLGGAGAGFQASPAAVTGGSSSSANLANLIPSDFNLYNVGFDANWEVDIFGRVRREVEASTDDLQAAVENRRDVLVTLMGEVARNYVELRGFQRQLAIAHENLHSQRETLDVLVSRTNAGLNLELDVVRARAQVASTSAKSRCWKRVRTRPRIASPLSRPKRPMNCGSN